MRITNLIIVLKREQQNISKKVIKINQNSRDEEEQYLAERHANGLRILCHVQ